MPFLLLDDAVDDATRRLQDFGSQQLQDLTAGAQGAGEALGQAAGQVGGGLQDITARLQDFGQQQVQNAVQTLQPLQQQAQAQQQDAQQALTRLHDFGQQQVTNLTQQAAQPSGGQFDQFGDQSTMAVGASQQQAVQPGGDLRAYARQAAQQAGIDPDIFVNQIQQESGFNPSAKSPVGAIGIAQFMPGTAQGMGIDPTDPYAALDAAAKMDAQNLQKYGGDWRKVLAAYNAGPNAVDQYGGVPPYKETQDYVSTILGGAKNAVQNVAQGAQQAVSNALPTLSQFGDKQLSAAEAYAACGPAAAVRFAQLFGRQPTLREAVDLASQVGWTPGGGMAGLGSESDLFGKMQIPHRTVGADWQALAREASSGNPVVISTPGHYFTADNYDPSSGAFHVGSSGTDLKAGAEWMTPAQMESAMGRLQGGLAVDNPQVPGPSPLTQGVQNVVAGARDLLNQGVQRLQDITAAVPPGQVFKRAGQGLQAVADLIPPGAPIPPGVPSPDVLRAAGGILQQPSPVEAMQTMQDLQDKYGPGLSLQDGQARGVPIDTSVMTPEDRAAYNQAAVQIGGVTGPVETGMTRMFHGTGADFPRVSPEAVSGEGNLFGPGYYLTSDPRVAGGDVARGGEPVGNLTLADQVTPVTRYPGEVLSEGYAQQRGSSDVIGLDQVDNIAAGLEQVPGIDTGLARTLASGMRGNSAMYAETRTQEMLDAMRVPLEQQQQILSTAFPPPVAGANVRPVDVPQSLNLFDMEKPLAPDQAESIAQQLNTARPGAWDLTDPEVRAEVSSWSQPGADGESVYNIVRGEVPNGSTGAANRLLADAGLDGITYAGGKRIPMTDAAGMPIEHTATVVFPDSLDKLRNAISGTQGGAIDPRYGAALGLAAAGALGVANRDRVMDTLQPALDQAGGFPSPQTLGDLATGGLTRAFTQKLQDAAAAAGLQPIDLGDKPLATALERAADVLPDNPPPGVPSPDVLRAGAGFLRAAPSVSDSLQTILDLQQKYGQGLSLDDSGQARAVPPDTSVMTPEDRDAYNQAVVAVGGVTSPVEVANRVLAPALNADPVVQQLVNKFDSDTRGAVAQADTLARQGLLTPTGVKAMVDSARTTATADLHAGISALPAAIQDDPATKQVVRNLTQPAGDFTRGVLNPIANVSSALKETVLSGSPFHMLYELQQAARANPNLLESGPTIGRSVLNAANPAAYDAWRLKFALVYEAAAKAGVTLPGAGDQDVSNLLQGVRGFAIRSGISGVGTGLSTYATDKAQGADDQHAITDALLKGGLGAVFGGAVGSVIGPALWERTVPTLKVMTWETLTGKGMPAEDAARFVNQTFGGLNLSRIARSPDVQAVARTVTFAPDVWEGIARQIGQTFNPDLSSPVGNAAKVYAATTALSSAFLLEGLNYALSGHFTNRNDAGHDLDLDVTSLTKPTTDQGQAQHVYVDTLGLLRAVPQIGLGLMRGSTDELGKFVAGRASQPVNIASALTRNVDYRGQPIVDPNANPIQRAGQAVGYALGQAVPAGASGVVQGYERAGPVGAAISALTGARVTSVSEAQAARAAAQGQGGPSRVGQLLGQAGLAYPSTPSSVPVAGAGRNARINLTQDDRQQYGAHLQASLQRQIDELQADPRFTGESPEDQKADLQAVVRAADAEARGALLDAIPDAELESRLGQRATATPTPRPGQRRPAA